jgi:ribosomal protein L35
MPKQKRSKTVFKRLKITSTGKLTRRHQLAAGHLKTNKSKGALNRAKKSTSVFSGEIRTLKKMLGI